jgi:hypothetical protein
MNGTAFVLAVAALAAATAASGCGFGPGDASPGRAELRVTREFGTIPMVTATLDDPTESDTVVRMLDSSADLETSFGGNFVDSIDGYAGSTAGGGDEDWFFFVNGYYSDIGSGETPVRPGDRIWWDYRYWSAAYRVPAVVGSWPEPFLHGYEGDRPSTVVQCLTDRAPCDAVMASLEDEGVAPTLERPAAPEPSPDELRILVGPWDAVRDDPAARGIEAGPEESGVYASFERCAGVTTLTVDDDHGRAVERLTDAGMVAAVRRDPDQPTWVVTGTDATAAAGAAAALDGAVLRDRYAVAFSGGQPVPLPSPEDAPADGPEPCR